MKFQNTFDFFFEIWNRNSSTIDFFLNIEGIQKFEFWVVLRKKRLLESAPGLQKVIVMACSEYLRCFPKSGGYADIKIIAIRCVDRNKIAETIDYVQKSL